MRNHPDRVQGEEAKKVATAKFAEISAAYELLTTGDSGASHPSFADTGIRATPSYAGDGTPYSGFQGGFNQQPFVNSFPTRFDPFGFGTFDSFHFTDPFELFRQTFGDIKNDSSFGTPFRTNGHSFMQQNMMSMNTGFGGFPSMFETMGTMPSGGFGTTTFSSSSYSFGGGTHSQGRMISTTTTTVNGKTVTRTEQTVIKPDGTRETVIDLTGDDIDDKKVPAIEAGGHKRIEQQWQQDESRRAASTARTPRKNSATGSKKQDSKTTTKSKHPRRYKVVSKEELEESNQSAAAVTDNSSLLKSQLSANETYVIDGENKVKSDRSPNNDSSKVQTKKRSHTEPTTERRGRKRKFCELMYRCLICCFPPCKRRRVANESSH